MSERLGNYHPEAISAYQDDRVLVALQDTSWFTPEFIVDVHDNEPDPEREGTGPFKDKFLGDFLRFGLHRDDFGPENAVFLKVISFLEERMVTADSHPGTLGKIVFADDEFIIYAQGLGADEKYVFDRVMISKIIPILKCLIVPPSWRRKVVKEMCRWHAGYDDVRRDTILWAELVRRGVKAYLKDITN